ncbi:calcium binding hemolysin protein, putative [Roseovarius sp. TM1035]|uniref:calcium-binding protein n=1 Tax=Roseovarius sp. TM1035 TaxID=391613 RepID=UPI0001557166|nr:calcium-binding protein [Roseovarius sp. TM1035]AWZ22084.1 Alkaline phosphatase [Roseovarius sp. AK1035]EDM29825.1 calcium binding hemolysin protein, putative [Roseovarius sp. TM1035]
MGGLLLLGLLAGVGLTAFVIDEVNEDDDDTNTNDINTDDTISGTPGDDILDGTARADEITARGGDDIVSAGGGDDFVQGGTGVDIILGGSGADTLSGDGGDDVLIGGRGDDLIEGGAGDDVLIGIDGGLNSQTGDELNRLIQSNPTIDALRPSIGTDQHGSDTLIGGDGEDALFLSGGDFGTGGAGEDRFQIGDWIEADTVATITDYVPASDFIDYSYVSNGTAPQVSVAPDDDGNALLSVDGVVIARVLGAATTLTPASVILSERADDSSTESGLNILRGTNGADLIDGSNVGDEITARGGNDLIASGGGRDEVFAGDGNDVVFGGNAADILWGGVGNDVVIGGAGGDSLQGNSGDDLILGLDIPLGSGSAAAISAFNLNSATPEALLEGLIRTPSEDLSGDDTLLGGSGNDVLVIGGDDTATGGLGADRFWLGEWVGGADTATITDYEPAVDQIVYYHSPVALGAATPVITLSTNAAGDAIILADGVPVAEVTGAGSTLTAAEIVIIERETPLNQITGSTGNDLITGRSIGDEITALEGNDVVGARGGDDQVFGGAGNDILDGGSGSDSVWGEAGDDVLIGGALRDVLFGSAGNDLIIGIDIQLGSGSAADIAAQGLDPATPRALLDDFARSSAEETSGDDNLSGGSENDVLIIGGDDTATGGVGEDQFWLGEWGRGADIATITDFDRADDQIAYVYTAATPDAAPPVVTLTTNAAGDVTVLADGIAVARILGAGSTLTAADVALIARPPAVAA